MATQIIKKQFFQRPSEPQFGWVWYASIVPPPPPPASLVISLLGSGHSVRPQIFPREFRSQMGWLSVLARPFDSCPAGPYFPATVVNDASAGDVAWTNPANAKVSDDTYATCVTVAQNTQNLNATGFNFNIAPGKQIDGIKVEVEAKTLAANKNVLAQIIKNGALSGGARSGLWATTEGFVLYSTSTDLWSNTWTPADINAANFGVSIGTVGIGPFTDTFSVDSIRVTVYCSNASASQTQTIDDALDALDEFVKQKAQNQDEFSLTSDEFTKTLSMLYGEATDFSDIANAGKSVAATISDIVDLSDDRTATLLKQLADSADALDGLTKLLAIVTGDRQDYSDDVITTLIRNLQSVTVDDALALGEDLVKTIYSVLTELVQINDALTTTTFPLNPPRLAFSLLGSGHFVRSTYVQRDAAPQFGWIGFLSQPRPAAFLTQTIDDFLDVLDGFLKTHGSMQSESAASSEEFTKTLSPILTDAVDLLEALDIFKSITLSTADSVDLPDLFVKLMQVNRDDGQSASDFLDKLRGMVADDRVDLPDALAKLLQVNRDELESISDNNDAFKYVAVTGTDTVDLSENIAKSQSQVQSEVPAFDDGLTKTISTQLTDSVSFSDLLNVFKSISADIADQLAVSDDFTKIQASALADAVAAFDEFLKQHSSNPGDIIAAADALVKLLFYVFPESLDASDAANAVRTLIATLSDAVDATDEFTKLLAKDLADSGTFSDEIVKTLTLLLADLVTITDLLTTGSQVLQTVTVDDLLQITDAIVKTINSVLNDNGLGNILALSDALTKTLTNYRTDTIILTEDAVQKNWDLTVVQEMSTIAEIIVKAMQTVFGDLVDLSDTFAQGGHSFSQTIDDALDVIDALTKLLAVLRSESQQPTEQVEKTLISTVGDRTDSLGEGAEKTLTSTTGDQIAFDDSANILKYVALSLIEAVDAVDALTKLLSTISGDSNIFQDAITSARYAEQGDRVDFSDTVSAVRSFSTSISEIVDILDGMTKTQSGTLQDSSGYEDAVTKALVKSSLDLMDAREELEKIISATQSEQWTVAETVSFARSVLATLQETQDVLDAFVKTNYAVTPEEVAHGDDLVKILLKTLSERMDVAEQLAISRIVAIILSELDDVRDDLVKGFIKLLDDSGAAQDALVKSLVKIIAEAQDCSDEALAVFVEIVYEYLETRLSGQHDATNRRPGVSALTTRIAKVLEGLPRKPGTKGHVR
jgi:hypothetical protein